MRTGKMITIVAIGLMLLATPTLADWQLGDGHKMHFPQLPDEDGWDVNATFPNFLADDWTCSKTGWIEDIHFWGSWDYGVTGEILYFHIRVYGDDPAGLGGPDSTNDYSKPGELLWYRDIWDWQQVPIDSTTWQGWYNPEFEAWKHPDHQNYWQYNITNIRNPCWQDQGTIYWLGISATVEPETGVWGWKTADVDQYPVPATGRHYLDDAVWGILPYPDWQELRDPWPEPLGGHSLDLAFVITPEPATLSLLALGGLAVLKRKRKS